VDLLLYEDWRLARGVHEGCDMTLMEKERKKGEGRSRESEEGHWLLRLSSSFIPNIDTALKMRTCLGGRMGKGQSTRTSRSSDRP